MPKGPFYFYTTVLRPWLATDHRNRNSFRGSSI